MVEQAGVSNLILIHFSTRFDSKSVNGIFIEVQAVYSGGLFLVKDHQEYILDKSSKLCLKEK